MKQDVRRFLLVLAVAAAVTAACTADDGPGPRSDAEITIPDLTGLSRARAVGLIDNLDLAIRVERIDVSEIGSTTPSAAGLFARGVVVEQEPPPDTRVAPGTTVTLFVPRPRPLRAGEQTFRLLTHCGLSYPLIFGQRAWLPVDRSLRRTINPPEGFASDGYYDNGTIRRVDDDTLIYTSSTGIEVEYEPTDKRRQGCE